MPTTMLIRRVGRDGGDAANSNIGRRPYQAVDVIVCAKDDDREQEHAAVRDQALAASTAIGRRHDCAKVFHLIFTPRVTARSR